jgi:large subunit ribosomal protein L21
MVGGEKVAIGTPTVSGAKVSAEIVGQGRSKKVIVYKIKRRKSYRRKAGHRQPYTELKVTGISA